MDRLISLAVAAALLAGCSGGGGSCLDTIDDAKARLNALQDSVEDPTSAGGNRITDAELADIRRAIAEVAEAERCLSES